MEQKPIMLDPPLFRKVLEDGMIEFKMPHRFKKNTIVGFIIEPDAPKEALEAALKELESICFDPRGSNFYQ